MKKILPIFGLSILLTACNTTDETEMVTATDLQHHRWELASIDGDEITQSKVPSLEISEKMYSNGFAGCNTFRGQAEINAETGQFRINGMAMTMKMCQGTAMYTERAVASTLSAWSTIEYTKNSLTISNGSHTLEYTLKDLM